MQILVHSVENYVYRYARANDIVQRRVKISVLAEKPYDTYNFFPRYTL